MESIIVDTALTTVAVIAGIIGAGLVERACLSLSQKTKDAWNMYKKRRARKRLK